jgi:hypothetical protein
LSHLSLGAAARRSIPAKPISESTRRKWNNGETEGDGVIEGVDEPPVAHDADAARPRAQDIEIGVARSLPLYKNSKCTKVSKVAFKLNKGKKHRNLRREIYTERKVFMRSNLMLKLLWIHGSQNES